MSIEIKVTKRNSGEPLDEQHMREYLRAFELINTIITEQLVEVDAMTVANALCDVAADVLAEAGMTQADVASLLETLARLSRAAAAADEGGDT